VHPTQCAGYDARWLAYADTPAGVYDVHVRAFSDKGTDVQISNAGGILPMWSQNGHELFYRAEDQRIMVVNYTVRGDSFVPEKPRVWFGKQLVNIGLAANLDLAPDGKRFIVLVPADAGVRRLAPGHMMLVTDFFDKCGGGWGRRNELRSLGKNPISLPLNPSNCNGSATNGKSKRGTSTDLIY